MFISALGTTRAAAGGFENQKKIDYDLNLALAQEAKAKGTKVYVLISSSGANAQSMLGYPKMKGELEDAVSGLGFEVCTTYVLLVLEYIVDQIMLACCDPSTWTYRWSARGDAGSRGSVQEDCRCGRLVE